MVTRRQGAPLLRGALAAGLASQRGEDAAQWVAGWSVPSLPLTVPFPALPGGTAVPGGTALSGGAALVGGAALTGGTATAQLMPRLDGRG
jgi:hypothetical protein